MLPRYAISAVAYKLSFGTIGRYLLVAEVHSEDEARGIGLRKLEEHFPRAQGWQYLDVMLAPVPDRRAGDAP